MSAPGDMAVHCWSSTAQQIERVSAVAVTEGTTVGFASVVVRSQLRTAVLTVISADRTVFGREVSVAILGRLVDELANTGTTLLQATVADTDLMSVAVLRAVARARSTRMRARSINSGPSGHIVIELELPEVERMGRHVL